MKDINFSSMKDLVKNTPEYKINDLGFADEEAYFAAIGDRVAMLKSFFSEVYFLEDAEEEITYRRDNGHTGYFKFDPIEIPANEEEFIKIRDNVYDRGGDPNRIVMGVYQLFQDPDYSVPNRQNRSDTMLASFFVKG